MELQSTMAGEKARTKVQKAKAESERILKSFTSDPTLGQKHRATIKVARRLIINAPYLIQGERWEVKSKSLGAGVYELSLERRMT